MSWGWKARINTIVWTKYVLKYSYILYINIQSKLYLYVRTEWYRVLGRVSRLFQLRIYILRSICYMCYLVSAPHPPPTLLASLKYAYSPCVLSSFFFLALLMLTYLYLFRLSLPFFDFDLDIVCFSSGLFLVGTMLSGKF